jgi:hypothetical protein
MTESDRATRRATGPTARRGLAAGKFGRRARDEVGAALVLALVFLVVAALTLTALVTFAGTGLLVTAPLVAQRSLQYGANGATEIAIQHVRYQSDFYQTLSNCLGTAPTTSVQLHEWQSTAAYGVSCRGENVPNTVPTHATVSGSTITTSRLFSAFHTSYVGYGVSGTGIQATPATTIIAETVATHEVTLSHPATVSTKEPVLLVSPFQRLVTFYAYLCRAKTRTPCPPPTALTLTQGNYLVKAVVGFGDRTASGTDTCHAGVERTCGESLIVRQWTVARANF